jgi:hypothetical protein
VYSQPQYRVPTLILMTPFTHPTVDTMSQEEKKFFRELGERIAQLRKEQDPAKRGPTPKLQQQLERLSALPKPKQRAVMEVLEAMLAQASR